VGGFLFPITGVGVAIRLPTQARGRLGWKPNRRPFDRGWLGGATSRSTNVYLQVIHLLALICAQPRAGYAVLP
jgi:hypothetical protein